MARKLLVVVVTVAVLAGVAGPSRAIAAAPADVVLTEADLAGVQRLRSPNADDALPPIVGLSGADEARLWGAVPTTAGTRLARVAYPTVDTVYVAEFVRSAGGKATTTLFSLDRLTWKADRLGWSSAWTEGGLVHARAELADGASMSSTDASSADGPECDHCALIGIGASLLYFPFCSMGFLCALAGAIFGAGISKVCTERGCPFPAGEMKPGFIIHRIVCQFTECEFEITVQNRPGSTTTQVGDSILWQYPPWSYGRTKDGFPQSSTQDTANAIIPFNRPGDFWVARWRHLGSDPKFQACTTNLEISITVVSSDNKLVTTGFFPWSKLFLDGCEGQKYIVNRPV